MRITHGVMVTSFLGDMNTNLNSMNKIQRQLNTGKVFSKPSDDPFRVSRSMQMYSEINANKQYNTNIKDTTNWMDTTDTALSQTTNCLQRIRELMVSAGNAAYGTNELTAIKDEINEKVAEFGQILNTSFDGKYIFGGKDGASKPVKVETVDGKNSIAIDPQKEIVIDQSLKAEISAGVTVDYNVNAVEILKFKDPNDSTNEIDVTKIFDDIIKNLSSTGDKTKVVGENLGQIDKIINNMLSLSSKVGAIQNRMESAQKLNVAQNEDMTEILSSNEDIDFVEKSMEMAVAQTVYTAALQTSAKVLQPTILDFLR
ncbi:flagellar hook-associated protein FlgL [Clostridium sp.]|uniref:flagellar hook-associated protein FlgL n=1 Tax=Clostridium sp. TaxID=1506 RepID=UPI0032174EF4